MDLLADYSDEEELAPKEASPKDDAPTGAAPKAMVAPPKPTPGVAPKAMVRKVPMSTWAGSLPLVNAAPDVDTIGMSTVQNFALAVNEKRLLTNPSIGAMCKPIAGPLEVGEKTMEEKFYNHKVGHVEKMNMSNVSFEKEYLNFHNFGHAANPARNNRGRETLMSTEQPALRGSSIWDKAPTMASAAKRRKVEKQAEAAARAAAEEEGEELAEVDEEEMDDVAKEAANAWGGFKDSSTVQKQIDEDLRLREDEVARQREEERAVEGEERETKERVTSVFHGTKESDYAGRSWIENKASQIVKDVDDKQCFLPKKWMHTWSGHTMGINQIRWFPETAHLILSASMDGTCKIWDYHNQRKCLRTYMGHDQGVRDVNFTNDGRRFYSVSYDKNIQYWDTETGQVISTFTNKKTNFSVAVHPDPSQQNIIITGCSNKKAVQWDANTASIVQEYDEHMGAVNTVTFCEDGKRLLTTSDDKKIFLWEYGIPVVVKYIAEPTMHSVPAVALCPRKKFLIGQSMDNKIITYEAFGRFKFQAKRQFKGHLNSGYAITPGFSADGKWVMSGDLDGKLWFWDWQKMKNYRVLKAHDGVCMSAIWHPFQPSRVVTCGWDGTIKMWD
mmetsp:Transcript_57548/g.122399  ORF Transcript_57548/g.122399 Transcript_57548/m.122399 type:complete len:614 (+) Transcript_57548:194-2035(+)